MQKVTIKEFSKLVDSNAEIRKKFSQTIDNSSPQLFKEIEKIASEFGYEIADEKLQTNNKGVVPLSDDDLSQVAGGGFLDKDSLCLALMEMLKADPEYCYEK